MLPKWSLAVVAALALAQSSPAQQTEAPRFEEEVVVSEVLLDATVTDKDGRVILGLGREDFSIEEGGEKMEVLGVSFYSSQQRVAEDRREIPGFDLSDIPEDRHFIIFIQEVRRSSATIDRLFARQQRAGTDLVEWVKTELQPADLVAVVSYGYKLKVHQDFTRDRQALTRAIGQAVRGTDPESSWPSRQPPPSEIGPLRRALPTGKELRKATSSIYKGLTVLAEAAATIPGRKNLVFLGVGFDSVRSSQYYRVNRMLAALNDANIAAYTLDIVPTGTEHTSRQSLNHMAIATGGDFFFTFIRFASPLERIAAATSGYYLIAYRSPHPVGASGFQRVKVKVANPEFVVRTRSGYSYGE